MDADVDIRQADIRRKWQRIGIDNIRRIWIIRLFLWIIRCPQIGLSDKISLWCHAIIYIAHFIVLLVLIMNLLG